MSSLAADVTDAPVADAAGDVADDLAALDDAEYHRVVLRELIELGMGLARRVAAVPQVDGPEAVVAVSAAFEQISRAVRRTVRLAQFIASAPATRPGGAGDRDLVHAQLDRPGATPAGAKERCSESLRPDALERVDSVELAAEFNRGRPVGEMIDEIRTDLGVLATQQRQRQAAEVVALHAWAAGPSRPAGPGIHDWVGAGWPRQSDTS